MSRPKDAQKVTVTIEVWANVQTGATGPGLNPDHSYAEEAWHEDGTPVGSEQLMSALNEALATETW